jgi:hypothetical protein
LNTNSGNTENTENSEITQIAAKLGEGVFQKYVIPRVDIQLEASKVTGITYSHSTIFSILSITAIGIRLILTFICRALFHSIFPFANIPSLL